MKPAEKLKRIKLISEHLFERSKVIEKGEEKTEGIAISCIRKAQVFVNAFEEFENEFLKHNGVENE